MRIVCVAALFLVSMQSSAAELYRWVDQNGQVHYGDKAPDAKKTQAKAVDLTNSRRTEAQLKEAELRADREKEMARKSHARQESTANAPAAMPAATQSAAPLPAVATTPCEVAWQKYRESQVCFAKFVQVNASVKAEAYKVCTEMKEPARCN